VSGTDAGNLLVLASAGSGKTHRLGNRIIGLIVRGAEPEKIVALTFTRKAAGEFADTLLTRLAEAAADPAEAEKLAADIACPDADFAALLERVVKSLHGITLGTIDSYFSAVVRSFQHELGLSGGGFDLLQGPRADALTDELLARIAGAARDSEEERRFMEAFRRSVIGREDVGVIGKLRAALRDWHGIYQEDPRLIWGPDHLCLAGVQDWDKDKSALSKLATSAVEELKDIPEQQHAALLKAIDKIKSHSVGSGVLGVRDAMIESILSAVATTGDGPLALKYRKEFSVDGRAADLLRAMVSLAAHSELAACVQRSRAMREIVAVYDLQREKLHRRKGRLGFDDVKRLMGQWATSEDARLRREQIDFRLDARTDHWLLDEFQDTSRADWAGLEPLVSEVLVEPGPERTVFIVGDKKQAIYGWRGGDVGLFDDLQETYGKCLPSEPMNESWRSCPEVLALVNRVCGDEGAIRAVFGELKPAWTCDEHRSADPLRSPERAGFSRVEIVPKSDEEEPAKWLRLAEILREAGVGERDFSCGVLVRSNQQVRDIAAFLRERDFDVIEDGVRRPGEDNLVGALLDQWLAWLANPNDTLAHLTLRMGPLAGMLERDTAPDPALWTCETAAVSRLGYAAAFAARIEPVMGSWSEFSRRRVEDLLAALEVLDAQGVLSAVEARDWIRRLEVTQSPGTAAVQVMTFHKAKGLGFDMVVLPELSNEEVPRTQDFDHMFGVDASGQKWVCESPPKWVRQQMPELGKLESEWRKGQRYEALCMLYVALTRAKSGLYVLLDEAGKNDAADRASLRNLVAQTTDGGSFQCGVTDWWKRFAARRQPDVSKAVITLPQPKRPETSRASDSSPHGKPEDRGHGLVVHSLLESLTWLDEESIAWPESPAGRELRAFVGHPEVAALLSRRGRRIDLRREQALEAVVDGRRFSGVMDRVHLHRDENGTVCGIEIIDFKTDADAALLRERHAAQLQAYARAMSLIYPGVPQTLLLLGTKDALIVEIQSGVQGQQ
jgi:ATP-dependent exoDNAse (exonuclease V) beta subunit